MLLCPAPRLRGGCRLQVGSEPARHRSPHRKPEGALSPVTARGSHRLRVTHSAGGAPESATTKNPGWSPMPQAPVLYLTPATRVARPPCKDPRRQDTRDHTERAQQTSLVTERTAPRPRVPRSPPAGFWALGAWRLPCYAFQCRDGGRRPRRGLRGKAARGRGPASGCTCPWRRPAGRRVTRLPHSHCARPSPCPRVERTDE